MGYVIGLSAVLTLLWLGFSGIYEPLIIALGVISIAITVFLTGRLGIIDRETSPYHRIIAMIRYAPWLILEIIKANAEFPDSMFIFKDPPVHRAYRGLLQRVITPKRMNALEQQVRDFCAASLDPLVGTGSWISSLTSAPRCRCA